MKLSISIVAYKNYKEIEKAIISIENNIPLTLSKEIYILDNGNTVDYKVENDRFRNFINRYSDIKYIDLKNNLGFGRAHNKVLSVLHSEYHCIMNPDISFNEDVFSPILSYMDNNKDVGMVIPNIIDTTGKRQLVYRKEITIFDIFVRVFLKSIFKKRFKKHTLQYMDYSRPFQVPFGQGSFLVIRSSLFKKIDGFDNRFFMYLEDADLCKRVNSISKLMYFPNVSVVHKWQKGSHKNLRLLKYHILSMFLYFKKWGFKLF